MVAVVADQDNVGRIVGACWQSAGIAVVLLVLLVGAVAAAYWPPTSHHRASVAWHSTHSDDMLTDYDRLVTVLTVVVAVVPLEADQDRLTFCHLAQAVVVAPMVAVVCLVADPTTNAHSALL